MRVGSLARELPYVMGLAKTTKKKKEKKRKERKQRYRFDGMPPVFCSDFSTAKDSLCHPDNLLKAALDHSLQGAFLPVAH